MQKGISLHIGLNSYDPKHYNGDSGALGGCENDARAMQAMAKSANFDVMPLLLTENATTQNFITSLQDAAKKLESGDTFMATYSGHGGQVWDRSGDESSNEAASYQGQDAKKDDIWFDEGPKDETLCLYNRQFWDDEVFNQLRQFKKGVRVIWITDCCHAASNFKEIEDNDESPKTRGLDIDKATEVWQLHEALYKDAWLGTVDSRNKSRELNCSLIQLAACNDSELSYDGYNGVFTKHLVNVWNDGGFDGSYQSLLKQVSAHVSAEQPKQTPQYLTAGEANSEFQNQQAFSI